MARIKICGIGSLQDAQQAVAAGAHALGFVFYPPSPRYIVPELAARIIADLPPFVTSTGLFVNEQSEVVSRIIEQTRLDLLQFHGDETAEFCQQFARPYIKAIRMQESTDLQIQAAEFSSARALLLDTYRPGLPGGTGVCFDWSLIPEPLRSRIILAGGLTPDNVRQAIQEIQPFGVDVSGGVETVKGKKDPAKVKRFCNEVVHANTN